MIDAEITQRLSTVESEQLAGRLATVLYLLNVSEVMTSQAEVDLQRVMTSRLLDELARLQQNASRVSDVTQDTRTRAHNFRVSTTNDTHRQRERERERERKRETLRNTFNARDVLTRPELYSLSGPHDIDDILKVINLKFKVTGTTCTVRRRRPPSS